MLCCMLRKGHCGMALSCLLDDCVLRHFLLPQDGECMEFSETVLKEYMGLWCKQEPSAQELSRNTIGGLDEQLDSLQKKAVQRLLDQVCHTLELHSTAKLADDSAFTTSVRVRTFQAFTVASSNTGLCCAGIQGGPDSSGAIPEFAIRRHRCGRHDHMLARQHLHRGLRKRLQARVWVYSGGARHQGETSRFPQAHMR